MNGHDIWRRVEHDYKVLKLKAPEGYEPVVDVHLVGREQPIELGFVETRRAPDDPWVRLQQRNRAFADAEPDGRHPGDVFVHVHESVVLRVEVRYAPTGEVPRAFAWHVDDDGAEPADSPQR